MKFTVVCLVLCSMATSGFGNVVIAPIASTYDAHTVNHAIAAPILAPAPAPLLAPAPAPIFAPAPPPAPLLTQSLPLIQAPPVFARELFPTVQQLPLLAPAPVFAPAPAPIPVPAPAKLVAAPVVKEPIVAAPIKAAPIIAKPVPYITRIRTIHPAPYRVRYTYRVYE